MLTIEAKPPAAGNDVGLIQASNVIGDAICSEVELGMLTWSFCRRSDRSVDGVGAEQDGWLSVGAPA